VQKRDHGERRCSLVAVDEGLAFGEEIAVRACLFGDARVGILAKSTCLWLEDGRCELVFGAYAVQPAVSLDRSPMERDDLIDAQLLNRARVRHPALLGEALQRLVMFGERSIRRGAKLVLAHVTMRRDDDPAVFDRDLDLGVRREIDHLQDGPVEHDALRIPYSDQFLDERHPPTL
jgi:hypothetical protein